MSTATAPTDRLYIAEWDEPKAIAEKIARSACVVRRSQFSGEYRWVELWGSVTIDAPWCIGNDECAAGPFRQVVHLDDPDAGEITVEVILSDSQDTALIRAGVISYDVNRID